MNNIFIKGFLIIYLILGGLWFRSSLGKISGGKFADTLGDLLTKMSQNNPYPYFKSFLQNVAIPNSKLFGTLTMWGEFLTAVAITLGSAYLIFYKGDQRLGLIVLILGLLGGMFLNFIFWLGFGYSNVSTDSLNLLMFLVELVGVVVLFRYLTS